MNTGRKEDINSEVEKIITESKEHRENMANKMISGKQIKSLKMLEDEVENIEMNIRSLKAKQRTLVANKEILEALLKTILYDKEDGSARVIVGLVVDNGRVVTESRKVTKKGTLHKTVNKGWWTKATDMLNKYVLEPRDWDKK